MQHTWIQRRGQVHRFPPAGDSESPLARHRGRGLRGQMAKALPWAARLMAFAATGLLAIGCMGSASGLESGDCIQVESTGNIVEVACSDPHDAVVLEVMEEGTVEEGKRSEVEAELRKAECPPGTTLRNENWWSRDHQVGPWTFVVVCARLVP